MFETAWHCSRFVILWRNGEFIFSGSQKPKQIEKQESISFESQLHHNTYYWTRKRIRHLPVSEMLSLYFSICISYKMFWHFKISIAHAYVPCICISYWIRADEYIDSVTTVIYYHVLLLCWVDFRNQFIIYWKVLNKSW